MGSVLCAQLLVSDDWLQDGVHGLPREVRDGVSGRIVG
jgi:hypothetical protein